MKKFILVAFASLMMMTSCDTLTNLALSPTALESSQALKKILDSSAFKAINTLRKVNQNGAESLLPKEVQPVLGALKTLGLGSKVDDLNRQIGNISKVALVESEGTLKDAIGSLKFQDAAAVVVGGKDAATEVLRKAMYASVKKRYSSKLDTELEKTDINKYWPMAAGAYNAFSSNKVNGSLSDLLAEKAVDALFLSMGKEESNIRDNYESLGSSVVNKVFDYYTKNRGGQR